MVRDQVSMERVAKWRPVVLPAPLGQAQSNVQGCCCGATASSSCTKLNCMDGEGFACSGA
jgi:hypothetical protein